MRVFLIGCLIWGSLSLLPRASALAQSKTLAIRDVTVVDVTDGSLRPAQTVRV